MAISNELSSDIAAALIAANARQPDHLHKLKEILIEVHSTLQQMTEQSRTARSFSLAARRKRPAESVIFPREPAQAIIHQSEQ